MDLREKACWLLLTFKCGLPIRVVNQIVKFWCQQNKRTLQEFFATSPQEWNAVCQLDDKVMNKLKRIWMGEISERTECTQIASMLIEQMAIVKQLFSDSIHIMTIVDENYPVTLKRALDDKQIPPVLFYAGDLHILERITIAIIGARNAGEIGLAFTKEASHYLTENGANVVSGYARGTDRAAYEGATSARGHTTVVLPHGINKISDAQAYDLLPKIEAGNVLLLSQFHPDARWLVSRAMERNKIVTALAQVVIVAEANTQGGTWDGAISALEQKRPLYVCQTESPSLLAGNNALIERGGRPLYWSVADSIRYSYTAKVLSPLLQESDMLHQQQITVPTLLSQLSCLLKEQNLVYNKP